MLAGVFLAFGVSLTILFNGLHVSHGESLLVPKECSFLVSQKGDGVTDGGLGPTLVALVEYASSGFQPASCGGASTPRPPASREGLQRVTSSNPIRTMLGSGPDMSTCLHESSQSISAPLLMDLFYVVTLISMCPRGSNPRAVAARR